VSLAAADGSLVNFSRGYPAPPINLADRDYFAYQSRPHGNGMFVSRPVRNKGNGKWTFYISQRLQAPDGRFLGVALVGFSTAFLSDSYRRIPLGEGSSVTLYRDDLTILARWPENERVMGQRNVTGSTFRVIRERGQASGVELVATPRMADAGRSVLRMGAVRRLAHYPLIVNVTVTDDVFLAGWRRTRALMLGGAACCTVAVGVSLFLLWWVLRRRERDLADMRALKGQAEAASAAKSSFLAMISHEIRTPLTAIIGFAETLGAEPDPARRAEAGGIIVRNGHHLLGIINDILDISKVEAGRLAIETAPFAPQAVVAEVEATMRGQAQAKGIALRMAVDWPFPAQVVGDAARWRQVLVNLVGNAVKFTERGGVDVRVAYAPETATLTATVADTGIGIAPADLARLFAPFTQADARTGRRFGGTGLGLYLAQMLARGMDGTIDVQSAPGEGSTFTVRVRAPLAEGAALLACAPPAGNARAAGVAQPVRRLAGTVLLAEDGPDTRMLVQARLGRLGLRCIAVADGALALAAVRGGGIDLVLMDMQMPVMDGLQATAALRADGCTLPVIALTANAMAEDAARCRAAGCDDVLAKPIDFAQLERLLARLLDKDEGADETEDAGAAPHRWPSPASVADALAPVFNAAMRERAADLARAAGAGDWQAAAGVCHRIKGVGATFGHAALTHMARDLERAIARGAADERDRLVGALGAYVDTLAPAAAAA